MKKGGVGKRGQRPRISVVGGSVDAGLGALIIHGLEAVACGEHPLRGDEGAGAITEAAHTADFELCNGTGFR